MILYTFQIIFCILAYQYVINVGIVYNLIQHSYLEREKCKLQEMG